ncbi:MAG: amidohydrolase/deacetylase family metallohydrolase [Balneolales bacterium]
MQPKLLSVWGIIPILMISISTYILPATTVQAQQIDILLKGGHVIDPKNDVDSPMDVAVADGKIFRVAENIPDDNARRVVNVSGMYVTPGIIDMHVHAYRKATRALNPDAFSFRSGVTTVVDGGTTGWRNFLQFKDQDIDNVQTRVLAFLSIAGNGSAYVTRRGRGESQSRITTQDLGNMDPVLTAYRINEYPDILVGVKVQHYEGPDFTPVERAVEAGEIAGVPVMVDFGGHRPPLSLETLLMEKLRPGDIFTHTYYSSGGREGPLDENGKVKPFIFEAREKGILFSVGHGGGAFLWHHAIPAMEQGFDPDIIDSDLHIYSMNDGMKDMTNLMSKFLNLGLSMQDVILRTTWNPALSINRDDLGNLDEGAGADIAVFSMREGDFGFLDSRGRSMQGSRKLETELTLRAGRVMWDLNGIASTPWNEEPTQY